MDRQLARLRQDVSRLRRDIRLTSREMRQLIEADLNCSGAARLFMRQQADLTMLLDQLARLKAEETA